jgi:hypothetical protein
MPAVSRGRRNTSLIDTVEEVAVGHGDYPRQGPFSGSLVRTETTTSWIARVTAAA